LNIAGVGVGGMGRQNLINLASQNIVALCDVDWGYADQGFARLDSDIEKLRDRLEHPDRAPASGQPPAKFDRVKAKGRTGGTNRVPPSNISWPAQSARCARYTFGPTALLDFGLKAFPVPNRSRSPRTSFAGTAKG